MKSPLPLALVLCTSAALAMAEGPAPTGTQYRVEAKVLSVPVGALGTNALSVLADSFTVSSNQEWSVGGETTSTGELLEQLETMAGAVGVDLLSAPRVVVSAGQEATIQIVQEIACLVPETNTLYRVRRHWFSEDSVEAITNGLYRMQALASDQNPGISLSVTTTPAGDDTVKTESRFRYNLLVEMTPIAGTGIGMGQPVIESRVINAIVVTRLGDWTALGGGQKVRNKVTVRESLPLLPVFSKTAVAEREENILVFLRVTKAMPDDSTVATPAK